MSINFRRSHLVTYKGRKMSQNEARGVALLDFLGIDYTPWRLPAILESHISYQPDAQYTSPENVLFEVRGYRNSESKKQVAAILDGLRSLGFPYSFIITGANAKPGRAKYYGKEGEGLDVAVFVCLECRKGYIWNTLDSSCHYCHKSDTLVSAFLYWHRWQCLVELEYNNERKLIPAINFIKHYLPEKETYFSKITRTKEGENVFFIRSRWHANGSEWVADGEIYRDEEFITNDTLMMRKGEAIMGTKRTEVPTELLDYLKNRLVHLPQTDPDRRVLCTNNTVLHKHKEDILKVIRKSKGRICPGLKEITEAMLDRAFKALGFRYLYAKSNPPQTSTASSNRDHEHTERPAPSESIDRTLLNRLEEEINALREQIGTLMEANRFLTEENNNYRSRNVESLFIHLATTRYGFGEEPWLPELARRIGNTKSNPDLSELNFGADTGVVYSMLGEFYRTNSINRNANTAI